MEEGPKTLYGALVLRINSMLAWCSFAIMLQHLAIFNGIYHSQLWILLFPAAFPKHFVL